MFPNTGGLLYPRPEKKFGKLKKQTVRKFQNANQARTGRNMVKFSSPNAPSIWLIFLCACTHASLQTCHHSASSILAVRISVVATLSQCLCSESPCGGRHWLAHPPSQDILPSIYHNLINNETAVASGNKKVVSVCDVRCTLQMYNGV